MPYFFFNTTAVTYPINADTIEMPINWCGFVYNPADRNEILGTTDSGGGKFFYNTGFAQVTEVRHAVVGLILIVLTVADYLTFAYFPIEKGLVV